MYAYLAQRLAEEHRNDKPRDAQQWCLAHVPGPKGRRRATLWLRSGSDGPVTVGWSPTSKPLRNFGQFAQPTVP